MMKNQQYNIFKEVVGEPPPIDESWWESILVQEEIEKNVAAVYDSSPDSTKADRLTSEQAADMTSPIDWSRSLELYRNDRVVDLQVTGYNRGGLLVSGQNMQGFVPVSHLIDLPNCLSEVEQEQFLAPYVDKTITLKVIECDPERGRVVFSERAALSEPGIRNVLLGKLQAGECVCGTVTNLTEFGVFVDLGGVEGLVHVSEISWGRVHHPAEVVKIGEQVRVYIISVDQERLRVALSMKRLCPNPWATAAQRYLPGQVTEAVVTSVVPFGVFARLEEGLDGLIHISQMPLVEGGKAAAFTLTEGQHIRVRVLQVDPTRQRLGLSLVLNK